jgi:PAS domain-containing protein
MKGAPLEWKMLLSEEADRDGLPGADGTGSAAMRRMIAAAVNGEDAARLTVDGLGRISNCNSSGETLFEYRECDLVSRHVSVLLPQLAELELLPKGEINPQLRFLSRIGCPFRAVSQRGELFPTRIFLNILDRAGDGQLSLIIRPIRESVEGSEAS